MLGWRASAAERMTTGRGRLSGKLVTMLLSAFDIIQCTQNVRGAIYCCQARVYCNYLWLSSKVYVYRRMCTRKCESVRTKSVLMFTFLLISCEIDLLFFA